MPRPWPGAARSDPTRPVSRGRTDAAGRRQYLYRPQFRADQEQAKHEHVLDVAEALPAVREAVEGHASERSVLTRQRVLAAAVRLLDLGFFRIGGDRLLARSHCAPRVVRRPVLRRP